MDKSRAAQASPREDSAVSRVRRRLPLVALREDSSASRVVTGLAKISIALRHHATRGALPRGLSPAQGQVLALLKPRPKGMRLSEIADALAVTAATASDTVSSLVEKGLVRKERNEDDGRALSITLTSTGQREAEAVAGWPDFLLRVVDDLRPEEKSSILVGLVKMLRALQERGEIPVARMCVTCAHFRPHAHSEADAPHHCTFVDAAFGPDALRIECPDQSPSPPEKQAEDWARFNGQ